MQFSAIFWPVACSIGRIGPAPAAAIGVLVMMLASVVKTADVSHAAMILWRPLLAIMSIMVTTSVADRVGLLERLATKLFSTTHGSASRVFFRVFVLSALTAAALNNDSAVLLLTPAIIALVRRRYPRNPELVIPFAFVVFMAAGVAPFVLSNPMNMIFAAYAGIDFNSYAVHMAPIALVFVARPAGKPALDTIRAGISVEIVDPQHARARRIDAPFVRARSAHRR